MWFLLIKVWLQITDCRPFFQIRKELFYLFHQKIDQIPHKD